MTSASFGSVKKYPVIFPLIYYILGIVSAPYLEPVYLCLFFLPAFALLLFLLSCSLKVSALPLKTVSIAMVLFFIGANSVLSKSMFRISMDTSFPRRLSGEIISQPRFDNYKTVFDFKTIEVLDRKENLLPKIRVFVYEKLINLNKGDKSSFLISLKRILKTDKHPLINKANESFGPDYVGFLKSSHEIANEESLGFISAATGKLRGKIEIKIQSLALKHKGILKSILLGNKNDLLKHIKNNFRRTGLAHLLVVSGFHLGIVFAFFAFLFNFILKTFKNLNIKYNAGVMACIMAVIPSSVYALMTGLPYPTMRAIMMLLVGIIAVLYSRPLIGMNVLLWVAFIITTFDPAAVFSVSFQMSFMAVFGIIVGLKEKPFIKNLKPNFNRSLFKNRLIIFVYDLFSVSFFAILFTAPVIALYFGGISAVSLPANIIVVPIFSLCILPGGIICMLLTLFSFPGVNYLWKMEDSAVLAAKKLILIFSDSPISFIEIKSFGMDYLLIYYGLLISFVFRSKRALIIAFIFSTSILAFKLLIVFLM